MKQELQAISQIFDVLKNYYTSPKIDLSNQKKLEPAKKSNSGGTWFWQSFICVVLPCALPT